MMGHNYQQKLHAGYILSVQNFKFESIFSKTKGLSHEPLDQY